MDWPCCRKNKGLFDQPGVAQQANVNDRSGAFKKSDSRSKLHSHGCVPVRASMMTFMEAKRDDGS